MRVFLGLALEGGQQFYAWRNMKESQPCEEAFSERPGEATQIAEVDN